jgi:hypothetical protein
LRIDIMNDHDNKEQRDYAKVEKIILSCKTLEQLDIAIRVACNYNTLYKGYVHTLSAIASNKRGMLRMYDVRLHD